MTRALAVLALMAALTGGELVEYYGPGDTLTVPHCWTGFVVNLSGDDMYVTVDGLKPSRIVKIFFPAGFRIPILASDCGRKLDCKTGEACS